MDQADYWAISTPVFVSDAESAIYPITCCVFLKNFAGIS